MPRAKLRTRDLHARVVEVALETLEAGDVALTARSVATAANTSTAALYELFGDKEGLIRAVFFEGFRMLLDALDEVPVTNDSRADLFELLEAVRRFSVRRPMLFEVMFARPFSEFRPGPDDRQAGAGVHRKVMQVVDGALAARVVSGERTDVALALISANRGLIAAELSGLLGSSPSAVRRRRLLTLDALLDGLGRAR